MLEFFALPFIRLELPHSTLVRDHGGQLLSLEQIIKVQSDLTELGYVLMEFVGTVRPVAISISRKPIENA